MRRFLYISVYILSVTVFGACSNDHDSSESHGNEALGIAVTDKAEPGVTYVDINGSVNLNMISIGSSSLEYGVEVSLTEDFNHPTTKTTKEIEGNKLRIHVIGLKAMKKYYYRVFVKASDIYYYGKTLSFTTGDFNNIIKTGEIKEVTLNSANVTYTVDFSSYNDKESFQIGIAYSSSNVFTNKESINNLFQIAHVTYGNDSVVHLSYLQPATTYYVCSFTTDGETYKFGEIKSFTTESNEDNIYLITEEAVNITSSSVTLQGRSNLEVLYGNNMNFRVNYYFQYSEILEDLKNNNPFNIVDSSNSKTVKASNNNGLVSTQISSLFGAHQYYYRIVAEIYDLKTLTPSIIYGNIISFTTGTSTYFAPDGYQLVWQDEFDGNYGYAPNENGVPRTELNPDYWTHEVKSAGWVNHELQNYVNHKTPEGKLVTELRNGKLRITALKENGKVYSGRVYAKVKEGWRYGYIEASIKLPKGKGTWPAFWMMPVNFRSWPADGEIDIMEEVGYHPDYVSSSLHANAHVHSNGTQVTHEMKCAGAEGEFHTYAILWTAKNITTYVDGKVQLSYDNRGLGRDDWPYDDPFYVIFNLAWGGDWGGAQGVDETALPVTMEVDYIRVFQKK